VREVYAAVLWVSYWLRIALVRIIGSILRRGRYSPNPPVDAGWFRVTGTLRLDDATLRSAALAQPPPAAAIADMAEASGDLAIYNLLLEDPVVECKVDLLEAIRSRSVGGVLGTQHAVAGTKRHPALIRACAGFCSTLRGQPDWPDNAAHLYRSSRWEKMFENYGALIRGDQHVGWGCAVGGAQWRDRRLHALAQWFCAAWAREQPKGPTGRTLKAVEIGYVYARIAPSPSLANSTLGGYAGNFYRYISTEQVFHFQCQHHAET
jgi:hypothetical protein